MAVQYERWSVGKIKSELIKRCAATTGRKTDLIDRLRAYDRNQDFKPPAIQIPEPLDPEWPTSGFQQLLPQHRILLPAMTKDQIEGYFLYRLAGDKQAAADVKALEKGTQMHGGNRVLACSVYITQPHVYLSGIVGASMKTKVTYNYKIRLDRRIGEPVNSHCECPAGKGPHGTCKHIAAVLLMLQHFISTGDVQVDKTCTENLQTFHQPKSKYNGSPVKAETLACKRKLLDRVMDDPRPRKYRNMAGYNDHVRNMMVNYCYSTSSDLAMRYIHPKADLQAAALEHDYLPLPYTEYWVDTALQITPTEADKLEQVTRKQSNSHAWFRARRWRLTASRFGEIIKMTDRRNKVKLCASLTKRLLYTTKAMLHGKQYERKAISQFEKVSGIQTHRCGVFVRSDLPHLAATPDAVVDNQIIVEVKCPYNGRNEKIRPGKLFPFLTLNANGETILCPRSSYYSQIQGQLCISKRTLCYFVVFTFSDLFFQKIEIDEEFCNHSLLPKLELFYVKYFRPYLASTL